MSTPAPPPVPGTPTGATKRNSLPLVVGGGIVLVIALVVVLVLVLGGGKAAAGAASVQDVADLAVDAAENLDVAAGIDLLCETPTDDQRSELDDLIASARDESGSDDPDVDYEVSDVNGDTEGSFTVTITSLDPSLQGRGKTLVVLVESHDGRSCISGATAPDGEDGETVGSDSTE